MAMSTQGFMQRMSELLIGDKYQLVEALGSGGGGKVYRGRNVEIDEEVAIKLEPLKLWPSCLEEEIGHYTTLASKPAFPRVFWKGEEGDFRVMVFELLGPSLEDLFVYCERRFSLKTTLMLADQLLQRFRDLHKANLVHRDVKPDNCLLGTGLSGNRVYLIDLGITTVYRPKYSTSATNNLRGFREPNLVGTCHFASISGHWGIPQSPRDDLEALGYMLIYFIKGSLPWQSLQAPTKFTVNRKVLEMKEETEVSSLCQGLPDVFAIYFKYVKSLKGTDRPDYRYVQGLFRGCFKKAGYSYDNVYDWTIREHQRLSDRLVLEESVLEEN